MSSISMMEQRLPPGFRFHPRDDELVLDYLSFKLSGNPNLSLSPMMIDVDLNNCEPWDLPEIACVGGKEWFFFNLRDRKYATGQRTNRATQSGYWKATGKDRPISRKGTLVGMRKTLVFYQGRAPKGKKTDWVMHEFRMEGTMDSNRFPIKEDWVLCRVFYKSRGLNPKPNTDSFLNDSAASASMSLPPLIDTFIMLNQVKPGPQHEQVPCFSSMDAAIDNSSSATFPVAYKGSETIGGLLEFDSEKKAIKALLSNITKFEGNPKREYFCPTNWGQEGQIEAYLGEINVLPSHVWNTF